MSILMRLRKLLSPLVWFLLPNLYVPEESVRRILLVKTGSLRYAQSTLDAMEKRFPKATVTVLTEEREFKSLQEDHRVVRVTFYRNIWQFPGLFWQIRREGYDIKVVLFTKEPTYEKFKALSIPLSARKMLVFNEYSDNRYWGLRDLQGVLAFTPIGSSVILARAIIRRWAFLVATAALSPFIVIYLAIWAAFVLISYRLRRAKAARRSLT